MNISTLTTNDRLQYGYRPNEQEQARLNMIVEEDLRQQLKAMGIERNALLPRDPRQKETILNQVRNMGRSGMDIN